MARITQDRAVRVLLPDAGARQSRRQQGAKTGSLAGAKAWDGETVRETAQGPCRTAGRVPGGPAANGALTWPAPVNGKPRKVLALQASAGASLR